MKSVVFLFLGLIVVAAVIAIVLKIYGTVIII